MATSQQRGVAPDAQQDIRSNGTLAPLSARERWRAVWALLSGPYPTLVSRAVLGGVFLAAGIGKALDSAAFARDITGYQMLAPSVVAIMAYGLPWLEILLGVYLIAGLYLRWSAMITGVLLIIFMVAMGQAIARGLTLQCGCFGSAVSGAALREQVNGWSIARDGVWLLMAVHLWFVPSIWTADAWLHRRATAGAGNGPQQRPTQPSRRQGAARRRG